MAKTPKASAAGAPIEPDAMYRVTVSRPVRLGKTGGTVLSPRSDNRVKGKVLLGLPDDAVTKVERL